MIEIKHTIAEQDVAYLKKSWIRLVEDAKEYGIHIHPDGHFDGKATGTIKIEPNCLHIVITNKPFYIPETIIRTEIAKMINGWLDG